MSDKIFKGYPKNKLSQKVGLAAVGLFDPRPNRLLNLTRRVLLFYPTALAKAF
jgi:hypothetical protein